MGLRVVVSQLLCVILCLHSGSAAAKENVTDDAAAVQPSADAENMTEPSPIDPAMIQMIMSLPPKELAGIMTSMPDGSMEELMKSIPPEQMADIMGQMDPATVAVMFPLIIEESDPDAIADVMAQIPTEQMAQLLPIILDAVPAEELGPLLLKFTATSAKDEGGAEQLTVLMQNVTVKDVGRVVNAMMTADVPEKEKSDAMAGFMGNPEIYSSLSDDKVQAIVDNIPADQYAAIFPLMIQTLSEGEDSALQSVNPEDISVLSEKFIDAMPPDVLLETFNAIPPESVPYMLTTFVASLPEDKLTDLITTFILELNVDTVIESLESVKENTPETLPLLLDGVSKDVIEDGIARGDAKQQIHLEALLGPNEE